MIKGANYLQKAHRLSEYEVDAAVTTIHPGQYFHLNAAGKWAYADGTKKSYPTLNSRYSGAGIGAQGELLEGRDDVSRSKKLAVLKGNFELTSDQYDKQATFVTGQPLVVKTPGVLTPYVEGTHKPQFIVGYVLVPPSVNDPFITYEA